MQDVGLRHVVCVFTNVLKARRRTIIAIADNHTPFHNQRSGNNSDGATLYVTDSPCIECAKLIIQAGIRRVVYGKQYRLTDGIELLRRAGIEVEYIPVDKTE